MKVSKHTIRLLPHWVGQYTDAFGSKKYRTAHAATESFALQLLKLKTLYHQGESFDGLVPPRKAAVQ